MTTRWKFPGAGAWRGASSGTSDTRLGGWATAAVPQLSPTPPPPERRTTRRDRGTGGCVGGHFANFGRARLPSVTLVLWRRGWCVTPDLPRKRMDLRAAGAAALFSRRRCPATGCKQRPPSPRGVTHKKDYGSRGVVHDDSGPRVLFPGKRGGVGMMVVSCGVGSAPTLFAARSPHVSRIWRSGPPPRPIWGGLPLSTHARGLEAPNPSRQTLAAQPGALRRPSFPVAAHRRRFPQWRPPLPFTRSGVVVGCAWKRLQPPPPPNSATYGPQGRGAPCRSRGQRFGWCLAPLPPRATPRRAPRRAA